MFNLLRKNSIPKIARAMPPALVDKLGKQGCYTSQEVKACLSKKLKSDHNINTLTRCFARSKNIES